MLWTFPNGASAAGTADLNVPMFIALRRFTLVCTIVLERSLMHKQHDRATIGAVALMIGGQLMQLFVYLMIHLHLPFLTVHAILFCFMECKLTSSS